MRAALAVGGYRDLPLLEDYWLWEWMMLGRCMGNLEQVVVDYRVDQDLFARRGGWRLYASDLQLQRRFVLDRVTTPTQFLRNVVIRGAYRFAPGSLRRFGYRKFIESSTPSATSSSCPPTAAWRTAPGLRECSATVIPRWTTARFERIACVDS